ncbi:MAG: hypothetical protein ACPGUD_09530 [Parashewanella sp.]
MILIVALVVIGALLLLIIGINIFQQHKDKNEADRRVQHQRQRAIIDETQLVLDKIAMFPCSNDILLMLYKRLAEATQIAGTVCNEQQKKDYERLALDLQAQISQLSAMPPNTVSDNVQIPDNDKQLIALVQMLKKLKAILRSEHNKGKVDPTVFATEENRINNLQLKINVDAMLNRAQAAKDMKQYGSAKQLLNKAMTTLNAIRIKNPNDNFSSQKLDEVKQLADEILGKQKQAAPARKSQDEEEDDIDVLFQPKRKW